MRKYILIFLMLLLCTIPLNVLGENKATDAGSGVFDIGLVAEVTIYMSDACKGDSQLIDFNIGSGLTYLNCSYFVIDNLAIVRTAFFKSLKLKGNENSTTMFATGPIFNYYIPLIDKLYFKTSTGDIYTFLHFASYTDNITQFGFGFGGGITYLLSSNLGINGMASYGKAHKAVSDGQTIADSAFDCIDIEIGLSIFL
jgi:hypothetical protein